MSVRLGLLGGQGVDVVEDVDTLVDGEGGAHFAEHVVLGLAWEEVLGLYIEQTGWT